MDRKLATGSWFSYLIDTDLNLPTYKELISGDSPVYKWLVLNYEVWPLEYDVVQSGLVCIAKLQRPSSLYKTTFRWGLLKRSFLCVLVFTQRIENWSTHTRQAGRNINRSIRCSATESWIQSNTTTMVKACSKTEAQVYGFADHSSAANHLPFDGEAFINSSDSSESSAQTQLGNPPHIVCNWTGEAGHDATALPSSSKDSNLCSQNVPVVMSTKGWTSTKMLPLMRKLASRTGQAGWCQ